MHRTLIPWMLLSVRVVFAPILIQPFWRISDHLALGIYLLAFVTDYLDGMVARAFGTATPALRKADSAADTLFHLALFWFICRHHPDEIRRDWTAIAMYLLSAAVWYTLDAIRWHRLAGFHAYSAKLFSVLLLLWIVQLLRGGKTGPLLAIALVTGTLSNIECAVISLRLDKDQSDVSSIFKLMR
jgi:CDP-diacylglycerol--glycerol-3-phosphate 3-phosphatidyltransferase